MNDPQQGFHQFSFNLLSIGGKVSNNHLSAVSDNNEYGDVSREWDVSARRKFLQSVCSFTAVSTGVVFGADDRLGSNVANAVVTDETSRWSNTEVEGSSYAKINDKESLNPTVSVSKPIGKQSNAKASDEFTVVFDKDDILNGGKLGLELQNVEFRTNRRVQVKSVKEGSLADLLGVSNLMVVVAVNGESTERTDAKGVQIMVSRAVTAIREGKESKDLELTFRDPDVFLNELRKISEGETLTTKVAPAGDTTQRREDGSAKGEVISQDDQKLSVSQIRAPAMCNRGATTDDLLEISYVGSIYETGEIFDGSAVLIDGKGIPGRGNDVSLFFVLGKQPFGQFPPGKHIYNQVIKIMKQNSYITKYPYPFLELFCF